MQKSLKLLDRQLKNMMLLTQHYEGIVKQGAKFSGSGRYTSRLTPVEE